MEWQGNGLRLLDQTKLPAQEVYVCYTSVTELVKAMQALVVRGAPALGCAAAYGMILGLDQQQNTSGWLTQLDANATRLASARPTAINLAVGVNIQQRLGHELACGGGYPKTWTAALLTAAQKFHRQDQQSCLALAQHGQALLFSGVRVLTHCNAGALATGGIGTALAPLHLAHANGLAMRVYADETRPLNQGSRLSAWELARHGIAVSVLPDSAAATLLRQKQVDLIFVGADRIAANGDVANKVGTYPLAVLAERHGIPFYVFAPMTTVDPACSNGSLIPIEQRPSAEIYPTAGPPQGVEVFNPAFDLTPATLIRGIITEEGVFTPHGKGASAWQDAVARRAQACHSPEFLG